MERLRNLTEFPTSSTRIGPNEVAPPEHWISHHKCLKYKESFTAALSEESFNFFLFFSRSEAVFQSIAGAR